MEYKTFDYSAEIDECSSSSLLNGAVEHDLSSGPIQVHDSVLAIACGSGALIDAIIGSCRRLVVLDDAERAQGVSSIHAPHAAIVTGDMCDFNLGETFDKIICPLEVLMRLDTEMDRIRAFEAFRLHCKPSGRILINACEAGPAGVALEGGHTSIGEYLAASFWREPGYQKAGRTSASSSFLSAGVNPGRPDGSASLHELEMLERLLSAAGLGLLRGAGGHDPLSCAAPEASRLLVAKKLTHS